MFVCFSYNVGKRGEAAEWMSFWPPFDQWNVMWVSYNEHRLNSWVHVRNIMITSIRREIRIFLFGFRYIIFYRLHLFYSLEIRMSYGQENPGNLFFAAECLILLLVGLNEACNYPVNINSKIYRKTRSRCFLHSFSYASKSYKTSIQHSGFLCWFFH